MTEAEQNKSALNRRKKKENVKFFLFFEQTTEEKKASENETPARRGAEDKELIEGTKKWRTQKIVEIY